MNDLSKKKLMKVLRNETSTVEAQAFLSKLDRAELAQMLKDDVVAQAYEAYNTRHDYSALSEELAAEHEKKRIWKRLFGKDKSRPPAVGSGHVLIRNLYRMFGGALSPYRFGLIAVMLMIIFLPLYMHLRQQLQPYVGSKDKGAKHPAMLQYALMLPDSQLARPKESLTADDTLAFCINVRQSGYYAVYIVSLTSYKAVIIDRHFSKGLHELKNGYSLSGCSGSLILSLAYSKVPLALNIEQQETLITAIRNTERRSILRDREIRLVYEFIHVR